MKSGLCMFHTGGARSWLRFCVIGSWLCGASAFPVQADQPEGLFGVAGNQQVIWLFQNMTHAESKQTALFFTYCPLDEAKKTRFATRPVGPIGGEIAAMAVSGRNLHIIYSDGTHQSLVPPTSSWSMVAGCKQVRERNLPESAVPLALAGDLEREALYALITSRQASPLVPTFENVPLDKSGQTDTVDPVDDLSLRGANEEKPPPPSEPITDLAIVRFESGRWMMDRPAPADFKLQGRPLTLWVAGGRIHVIYNPNGQGEAWTYRSSATSEDPWSEAMAWPAAPDPDFASGSVWEDQPILLVGREASFQYWKLGQGGWKPSPLAASDVSRVSLAGGGFAAYLSGAHLGLARREEGASLHFGRWNIADGSTLDPLAVVPALVPPDPPTITSAAKHLLEYAVLGLALAAVFIWRRSSIVHHPKLAHNQRLARVSRRALAFGIDMAILTPAVIAVFYRLLLVEEAAFPIWNANGVSDDPSGRYWFRALVGLCVGIYGAIFESAMSSTPGKRALRLRVVCADGKPLGFGRVLVRNLARVVEFHFVPLVLLVAVTFGKQRLGDLLARSYVVEPGDTSSSSPDEPYSRDDSDFD